MTKNHAAKNAARAYQTAHPGTSYAAAVRITRTEMYRRRGWTCGACGRDENKLLQAPNGIHYCTSCLAQT
jgi:formamidopyrimidine-DNA glycosylase